MRIRGKVSAAEAGIRGLLLLKGGVDSVGEGGHPLGHHGLLMKVRRHLGADSALDVVQPGDGFHLSRGEIENLKAVQSAGGGSYCRQGGGLGWR